MSEYEYSADIVSGADDETYLIPEATHSGADGLLDDLEGPDATLVDGGHGSQMIGRPKGTGGPGGRIGRGRGNTIH